MFSMEESLIYSGQSMLGTFRPGDRLIITPATASDVKRGDVIVYQSIGIDNLQTEIVVHRILAIGPAGCITRGDNNLSPDQIRVTASQIKGKVTHRIRDRKNQRIPNGTRGFLWAGILNILMHGKKTGRKFLKIPYRCLKKSNVIGKLWQPKIEKIIIQSNQEQVIKYIHKKRVVGYYWPQRQKYLITKPYDLVIKPQTSSL